MASATANQITPRSQFSSNPRQWEAWNESHNHRFLLYGGAAGGGKSYFLRWWCVFYLIWLKSQGIRGAQVMLACEDYPSLLDRQISKIHYEFPRELGELKESTTREFVLNDQYGSGKILLRNLDDPSKYLSTELAGIALDELTRNELSVFNFLRSRLRWPGVHRPRFVAATNPGGKGHAWVKKYWVNEPRELPMELAPLASEFYFVPAKASDNPFLSAQYYEDLKTLPAAMAKAYAEGSWDMFAGQYFTNFLKDKHTVRAEQVGIKPWWPKWVSIDWGFEHEAAAYWHTTENVGEYNQRHVTYREYVQNHLSPRMLAQAIVEKSSGEQVQYIYLSPDAFAKRTSEEPIAEQMGEVFRFHKLPPCTPADDDRIGGWMLMYQLLDSGEWKITDNCTRLIENLPILVRDPKHVEDILKVTGDDPADAARYGLKSRLDSKEKPYEYKLVEVLDAITDYTQKHIMHLKMEDERVSEQRELNAMFRHIPRWKRRRN